VIYLSGCTGPRYEQAIIDMGVGLLIQPSSYAVERVRPFPCWAADNGCYPPDPDWSPRKWLSMLGAIHDARLEGDPLCRFVLCPDMPFDHDATLRRWERWHWMISDFGLPVAFAVQDGATIDSIPWDWLDVAFLAGSTEWKCGEDAYNLAVEARNRGKWVHMGRVNSWDRLDWASRIGCDSSDGTFMKHGKPEEMTARLKVWLDSNEPRLTQMGAQA
jgi:hypothetical protein